MRGKIEIDRLKARLRSGKWGALANIAIEYRDLGNFRRAYFWWKKEALLGGGDEWVDVGYCLEFGIGVRKNHLLAIEAYKKAIGSKTRITEYGREEACYRLAAMYLKYKPNIKKSAIINLLKISARDGDYPEADILLNDLGNEEDYRLCNCRRGRNQNIKGQAYCHMHYVKNRNLR